MSSRRRPGRSTSAPRAARAAAVALAVIALTCAAAAPALAITRCQVLKRAQSWVDASVPYSQSSYFSNSYGKYRQDCSGYVSMAWALSSSYVTSTLPQVSHKLGSFSDLEPGDAINHTCCHVVLFKAWVTPGVKMKVYAEATWGTNAQIQTWTVAYAKSNGYAPYRLNSIAPCCKRHCDGSKIVDAHCGVGDCAAYGSSCVDDALGVRCVFSYCPAIGKKLVCVDDKKIGTCNDGKVSIGDCSAFGGLCSTAGASEARCVSSFCVANANEIPVAHDICLPDGTLAHCNQEGTVAGQPTTCAPDETCTVVGGNARCISNAPPPDPPTTPDPPASDNGGTGAEQPGSTVGSGVTQPAAPSSSPPDPGVEHIQGGCSMAGGASTRGAAPLALVLCLALLLSAARRRRR